MFAIGIGLYTATTKARDHIGRYGFLAYIALLLALYIGDRFGSPPASVNEIAWVGIAAGVILIRPAELAVGL
jgi:hypothetical protein